MANLHRRAKFGGGFDLSSSFSKTMYIDWENYSCAFCQGLYLGKATSLPWCRIDWVSISLWYVYDDCLTLSIPLPVSGRSTTPSVTRPVLLSWLMLMMGYYASGVWARPHRETRSGVREWLVKRRREARGAACAHRRGHASNPIMATRHLAGLVSLSRTHDTTHCWPSAKSTCDFFWLECCRIHLSPHISE